MFVTNAFRKFTHLAAELRVSFIFSWICVMVKNVSQTASFVTDDKMHTCKQVKLQLLVEIKLVFLIS